MYKVLRHFYDLANNGYEYNEGDVYKHDGVSDKRLAELSSANNKLGVPLIVKIEQKPKKVKE